MSIFRTLTKEEEIPFRKWAREEWKPEMTNISVFHPSVRDEIRIIAEERGLIKVSPMCKDCGEIFDFYVEKKGMYAWLDGTPIQEALPNTPPELRELLISRTCNECWSKIFEAYEDEEYEDEEKV